jgi:hypothetical protein
MRRPGVSLRVDHQRSGDDEADDKRRDDGRCGDPAYSLR